MYVFHIPSSFPSRHEAIAGISAKDFIHAFSNEYPDTRHTVSLFYETTYHFLLKKNKFLSEIPKYLLKRNGVELIELKSNLNYCYAEKSLIYSTQLGYNEKRNWLNSHRGNLNFIIKKFGKPDILHAQFTQYAGWVAWKLSKEYSIPYIITERFGPFPPSHLMKKNVSQLIDDIYFPMKEAAALVSVSESHAQDIEKFIDRKVSVIHNIADEELFVPIEYPKENRFGKFTFITITSSYQSNKGIEDLLVGISILKRKGFSAKFIIGGGAKDNKFKYLKTIAKKLDIESEIEWTDKLTREETALKIQYGDCFISPSIYESFGMVCLEAIACGKPVIATKSGGPESIINEINGLLVDVRNPEMLAEAMEHMIKYYKNYNPDIIRRDFINRFSKKAITNQYYELYKTVVK